MRSKIRNILTIILIFTFVTGIVALPDRQAAAYSPKNAGDAVKGLEVLEIQPGFRFELDKSMFKNYSANITQMSMKEFISKVDEINGKYDLIYIGNNAYDEWKYCEHGGIPTLLPQGGINVWPWPTTEYYDGIDITNLKAEKIKEYIHSGQIVVFDASIFNDEYRNTKLYKNFIFYKNNQNYPNFITVVIGSNEPQYGLPGGRKFTGEYYDKKNLNPNELVYVDNNIEKIDFDWGLLGPGCFPIHKIDNFSVRWTGEFVPETSGTYTFTTETDDGVKLYIYGKKNNSNNGNGADNDNDKNNKGNDSNNETEVIAKINDWGDHELSTNSVSVDLEAGKTYKIVMEYYESYGVALAKLYWTVDSTESVIAKVMEKYEEGVKRPSLAITYSPVEYTGLEGSFMPNHVMEYCFDAVNNNGDGDMKVNLYIDIDGNGLFKDDELVAVLDGIKSGAGYALNCRISDGYTGVMPWKLELIDKASGAKNYETGFTAFVGEPLTVRVLQLCAPNNKNTLYMSSLSNTFGQNLLEKEGQYKIEVTEMDVTDFDENYPNPVNGKPTVLNGNYDMVIIGFADCYGKGDLKRDETLAALQDFIRTGQSVMFTHDTLNYDVDNSKAWGYHFTQVFRDIIGQNIYVHDEMPNPGMKSYGFTRLTLKRAELSNIFDYFPKSNKAFRLNKGLLTTYPFILGDIDIALTHHQYFRLDLEDEDVVTWYTLSGHEDFNKFDGRNDYYTYTKGNITFSGTGHTKPDTLDEYKLFINTAIKASRGANHAPVLEVYGISDNQNITETKENLKFTVKARDIDVSDRYLGLDVSIEADGRSEKILSYRPEDRQFESNVEKGIVWKIDQDFLRNADDIKLKIAAYDDSKAEAVKVIKLSFLRQPELYVEKQEIANFLTGDTGNVRFTISAESTGVKAVMKNIRFTAASDNGNVEILPSTGWTKSSEGTYSSNIDDIYFKPDPTWTYITKELPISVADTGEITYELSFDRYEYDDTRMDFVFLGRESKIGVLPVNVKSGTFDIEVYDKNNHGIKNAKIIITKPDGSTIIAYTGESGSCVVNGLSSGDGYNVAVQLENETYSIFGPDSFSADLSYDSSYHKFVFIATGDPIANVSISSENGTDEVLVIRDKDVILNNGTTASIYFNVKRPLEVLGFKLVYSLKDLSLNDTPKLYRNGVSVGNCVFENGKLMVQIPEGEVLDTGLYEIKLPVLIPENVKDGDFLGIDFIEAKEPHYLDGVSVFEVPENTYLYFRNLNIGTLNFFEKNGSTTAYTVKNGYVHLKISFKLSVNFDSVEFEMAHSLDKNTNRMENGITRVVKDGMDITSSEIIDEMELNGMQPGSYDVYLISSVKGNDVIEGLSYSIILKSVNLKKDGKEYKISLNETVEVKVVPPPRLN